MRPRRHCRTGRLVLVSPRQGQFHQLSPMEPVPIDLSRLRIWGTWLVGPPNIHISGRNSLINWNGKVWKFMNLDDTYIYIYMWPWKNVFFLTKPLGWGRVTLLWFHQIYYAHTGGKDKIAEKGVSKHTGTKTKYSLVVALNTCGCSPGETLPIAGM